jgi:hypothetical protein
MQNKQSIHILLVSRPYRLPRAVATSNPKAGSQNAVDARISLRERPKGVAEAVGTKAVLIVSVFVCGPPEAVNALDGLAKLQEK